MRTPLSSLARKIAAKPEVTAAVPSQEMPGGVGSIVSYNADGTLTVLYNGTEIPCFYPGTFAPTPGNPVLVLHIGNQNWAIGSTQPNPIGICYATSGSTITGGVTVDYQSAGVLEGGMTFASTAGSTGLIAPCDGVYLCESQLKLQPPASTNTLEVGILNAGSGQLRRGNQNNPTTTGNWVGSVVSCPMPVKKGQRIAGWYSVSISGTAFEIDAAGEDCYLSAQWIRPYFFS